MAGALSLQSESTEQVLVAEREVVSSWLENLEKRLDRDERLYERVLQLRRLVGKLDSRIRLVRDVEGVRQTIVRESGALSGDASPVPGRISAKRSL